MIMMYTSHQDYCFDNDNGLIFDALKTSFGGTDYKTILSHDQDKRDGQAALFKIICSNTPDGQRFGDLLSLVQNLQTTIWKDTDNTPLMDHVTLHRNSHEQI